MKTEYNKCDLRYGLFFYYKNGVDFEHIDGWDEYGNNKMKMKKLANEIKRLECWHDDWSEQSQILIEIWENDYSGMWGNTGEPIYRKEFTAGE